MKKTILFDADGTLLDSLWVWENLVKNYLIKNSLKYEKDLKDILWSLSFIDGIKYIKEKYKFNSSIEKINEDLQSVLRLKYSKDVKPFNGVYELLKSLQDKNYNIIIASASNKELLKSCFIKNNLDGVIDNIISEKEINYSKSNNKFFEKVNKKFNLNYSSTILVDDNLNALKSAKSLNIKTIGILNKENKKDFLNYCNLIVENIGDINEESINNCWK